MDDQKNHNPEFESLNIDNLDIEELESRLELAAASGDGLEGGCYIYSESK